jgi:PPOX class probable F420-dependent enzyme
VPDPTPADAYARFVAARVARLATVTPVGHPHVVPIVFAVIDQVVYSAVDHKPKRTAALQRLANIRSHPATSLLVDRYDDDWTRLWWVRADGRARVLDPDESEARSAVAALQGRYPQHRAQPPTGPVVAVEVERWTGWAYALD